MNWKAEYEAKRKTPAEAVKCIRSGDRVYVGSGCAVPQELVRALVERSDELRDVEIVHLLTFGMAPYSRRRYAKSFHHNAFFIGGNVRDAVNEGRADYTPVFLSEIPALFRSGQMPLDCAMVMVSPPDRNGYCSLGIHPDLAMTAIHTARRVVAEVNRSMPRVHGDTFVHVRDIDMFIENTHPLVEFVSEVPGPISSAIGRHIASLVPDGATLQLGIGKIPDAILPLLVNHKDLGVHSEMIGTGVIDLMNRGVITNARKTIHPGKVVSSFAMGTFDLYEYLEDNPAFEFHPTEYVNDPRIIAQNPKMVSVNSAVEVDLTGQVVSDSIGHRFYSGIGGQVDFIRGAAMSDGGRPILALPSTAANGTRSRIVTELTPGAGVVTSRGDAHYVVTEYGVAYLHGKSVRKRAMALVEIAHPDFRPELRAHAVNRKLIPVSWQVPSERDRYPDEFEETRDFGGELFVVRPIRSDDADRLMRFFYSHDPETVYGRYRFPKQSMPREEAVRLCTLDYKYRFALGVFRDKGNGIDLVAIGRYEGDETTRVAEPAFVVHEDYRRRGMADYMYTKLRQRAAACGLTAFEGSFSLENRASIELHRARGNDVYYSEGLYWYQDSLAGETSTSLST